MRWRELALVHIVNTNMSWRSHFPPAQWLRTYNAGWLKFDAIAGITLAAYAIPVSMAYATLAGLPPQHGIYCYLLGGACYALFGTSRQLAIGPTSAISLLVGSTVAGMAEGDPSRWIAIAALSALVVAALSGLAWLLRLSGLVNFISDTILLGFKAGAALTIAMTQLPKLFGVPGGGDHFFERTWVLVGQLNETNLAVLGLGIAALVLLLVGEKFLPGWPMALVVVALATTVVSLSSLKDSGVATVGRRYRRDCRRSASRPCGCAMSTEFFHLAVPVSCFPTSKAFRRLALWPQRITTKLTLARSCLPWARPI